MPGVMDLNIFYSCKKFHRKEDLAFRGLEVLVSNPNFLNFWQAIND